MSTGGPPQQPTSMVTYGAITGFGSVFVNGIHFDVSGAAVTDDGRNATTDDLRVGQIVRIEAERHGDDDAMPRASKIEHDAAIEGEVSVIDAAAGTLLVLGQRVIVNPDTLFDDGISPPSLAGIAIGDRIEADGFLAADGALHATRIERASAGAELEVTGRIADLDTAALTFAVNLLTVRYDQAVLADFPASGPADGDLVEVKGGSLNANGELVATRVELKRFDGEREHEADEVEVEGLVTRFVSPTDFDVNDRPATTTSATRVEGGSLADLALGRKVEVEGRVDANGVLVAEKVSLRHASDIRIDATIEAIDTDASTIRVLGIVVTIDMHTRFDDHGPNDDRFISLSRLNVGDRVEIRATAAADDVLATRLERTSDSDSRVELQGPVGTRVEPNFTVLGTMVATLPGSELEGLSRADLFGDAPLLVSVRGTWDGSTLTAERIEADLDH